MINKIYCYAWAILSFLSMVSAFGTEFIKIFLLILFGIMLFIIVSRLCNRIADSL